MYPVNPSDTSPRDKINRLAAKIKFLIASKDMATARDEYQELITRLQTRASRIAYYYLRERAEMEEAVQDAFLKAFLHLPSFRDEFYFDVWFTRILVNGCLDRLRATKRRTKWFVPAEDHEERFSKSQPTTRRTPEGSLLEKERRAQLIATIDRLPARQRDVTILHQLEGHSTSEVAEMLDITDATVRVHLFRALKSLRHNLKKEQWLFERPDVNWANTTVRECR